MFDKIVDTLKCFADKIYLDYEHNKPEILIYGGAAGLVVSGVLACVATVKAQKQLEKATEDIKKIDSYKEAGKSPTDLDYTEERYRKDKRQTAVVALGKIALGYLPPIALAVVSAKCIHDGVTEGRERITGLSLALAAETARADKLIERAKKHFGEDAEDKLLHDIHEEEVEEKDEHGNSVKKKKTVEGEDISEGYRVVLNRYNCPSWFMDCSREYNFSQLKVLEAQLNAEMVRKGSKFGGTIVTASDVMRMLEYRPAESSEWKMEHFNQGYVYRPNKPVQIDFGLDEAARLIDYGVCDKNEIVLHINFMNNIWNY